MSIYIFGDSITRGHFGIGYVKYLDTSFITKGWNGATLQQIITFSTHHIKKIEAPHSSIIFQGGVNDALYSYLSNDTNGWSEYVENKKVSTPPTLSHWKEEIVKRLQKVQITYPTFSFYIMNIASEASYAREDLLSITTQYNSVIEEIGKELSIGVIDLFSEYEKELSNKSVADFLPQNNKSIEEDAIFIAGDEEKAAQLSKERALFLTTDGIHPNKDGAHCIAKAINSSSFL